MPSEDGPFVCVGLGGGPFICVGTGGAAVALVNLAGLNAAQKQAAIVAFTAAAQTINWTASAEGDAITLTKNG